MHISFSIWHIVKRFEGLNHFSLTKYATSSLSWKMNKLYKTRTCSKWVTLDLDPQPGRIREPPIDDLPFFGGIFEFHLCSLSDRGEILFVSYWTPCVYIGKNEYDLQRNYESSLTSYKQNNVAVNLYISINAAFLPLQTRFPAPNVKIDSCIFRFLASHSSVVSSSRGNHLSGTNWSASSP